MKKQLKYDIYKNIERKNRLGNEALYIIFVMAFLIELSSLLGLTLINVLSWIWFVIACIVQILYFIIPKKYFGEIIKKEYNEIIDLINGDKNRKSR